MMLLKKNTTMDVKTLSAKLGVTETTIRKDFTFLANQGLIVRTYGAAIIADQKDMIRLVSKVLSESIEEKEKIARTASEIIRGGMMVMIDTGSTTYKLVPFIKGLPITIVTNSLLVASRITPNAIPDLVMIGGQLSKYCMGFIGPIAKHDLSQLYADILFLGTAGYSIKDDILTCASIEEAEMKRTMMNHAKSIVLLADSSKHEKKGYAVYGKVSDLSIIITDALELADIEELNSMKVETIIAK